MSTRNLTLIAGSVAALIAGAPAYAQTPPPAQVPETMPFDIPYGTPIGIGLAKQVAAAAVAEMGHHPNWKMAVAVVDPSGELVYFEKADGTQIASVRIAQEKARVAAQFRRPSKVFADAVASGAGVGVLSLGVVASEGGIPLVEQGKLVGAIGVSGGIATQDGAVAKAGAEVVK